MKKYNISPILIIIIAMIILNVVNGRFNDFGSWIMSELLMLPGIIIGLSFHEFAHGAVSHMLGDPTPKAQGRLTINPMAHIDPIGFFALLFAGFGWGIPVEINPTFYKHRRIDELLVSIAGVVMNFIIAIVFTFILKLMIISNGAFAVSTLGSVFCDIVQYVILINVILMIFNLLPIPPLDGFGIITEIFNLRKFSWYYKIYDKGFLILLALIIFNITDFVLNPAVNGVYSWLIHTILY